MNAVVQVASILSVFAVVSLIGMRIGIAWTLRQLRSERHRPANTQTLLPHETKNTAPANVDRELSEP